MDETGKPTTPTTGTAPGRTTPPGGTTPRALTSNPGLTAPPASTNAPGLTTDDEAALAPFFQAARTAAAAPPPRALLDDILADAARISAARHPALPERRQAPVSRRGLGWLLAPLGGWPGAAVLGASAAVGFWAGIAGSVTIDSATGVVQAGSAWSQDWSAAISGQKDDGAADPVASFYDLAAMEG